MKKFFLILCVLLCFSFAAFAASETHTHDYSTKIIIYDALDPCTKPYIIKSVCACGDETIQVVTTPIGHNLDYTNTVVIVASDCVMGGKSEAQCMVCKQWIEYDTEPNSNHTWTDWETVSEATCIKDGSKKRICLRCRRIETLILPATGIHQFDMSAATVTERGSCEDYGYYTARCLSCGVIFTGQNAQNNTDGTEKLVIAPRKHTYKDGMTLKQVSCLEDGQVLYTCVNTTSTDKYIGCTYSYTVDISHTTEEYSKEYQNNTSKYHKWIEVVEVKPTQKNPGIHYYYCETCGLVGPSQSMEYKVVPTVTPKPTATANHNSSSTTNANGITIPATGDITLPSYVPILMIVGSVLMLLVLAIKDHYRSKRH